MRDIPPHDIIAEQATLGACLIDADAYADVCQVLAGPEDFFREAHQDIFRAIRCVAGGSIDLLTVVAELRASNRLDQAGGPGYLDSLISTVQSSAHAGAYARIVADMARRRALLAAGRRLISLAQDDSLHAAGRTEQALATVSRAVVTEGTGGPVHITAALEQAAAEQEARAEGTGTTEMLPTGYAELDRVTGGLLRGGVTVLAARTSMGKTALSLSVARHVSTLAPVHYWSGEMPRTQLARRLAAARLGCPPRDVGAPQLRQVAGEAVEVAPGLWLDDVRGLRPATLAARVGAAKLARPDLALVVVDHLGLLAPATYEAISEASQAMLDLAGRHQVAVLLLVQLSRALERRDHKEPVLSDLRDSGRIEEDACAVWMLHRPAYYAPGSADPELGQVWIRKSRDGPTGRAVRLRWVGASATYTDPLPRSNEKPARTRSSAERAWSGRPDSARMSWVRATMAGGQR